LSKRVAEGKILDSYKNHNEPDQHVSIAVGLLKNPSRYDFLVEKVTELGVKEIIPLTTSRTISFHAKTERWQKLALAAVKQSCRSYLPRISDTINLEELLNKSQNFDRKIIFHEKADHLFSKEKDGNDMKRSTLILIGPEGGFSDEEVELCVKSGFNLYSLGERRLRTETAAIVAASLVLL
jgi:16S rRNA (uracil1498-N3)-methyltransferase